jgi:hypothetical protein
MNLENAQKLKIELDKEILRMINHFELSTKCLVSCIYLKHGRTWQDGIFTVDVDTCVELSSK